MRKRFCSYFISKFTLPKFFFTQSIKKTNLSEHEALSKSFLEGISELISEDAQLNIKMERITKFLNSNHFSFINIRGKFLFEESYDFLKNLFIRSLVEQDDDMIRIFIKLEKEYGILKNDFDISMLQFLNQKIRKDLFDLIIINFAYLPKYRAFVREEKSIVYFYASSFNVSFRNNIDKELLDLLIEEPKNKHLGLVIYSNICKNILLNNRTWFSFKNSFYLFLFL